jgi:hypothetical protein
MQPLPPSPALTLILASSMNIDDQGTGTSHPSKPKSLAGDLGREQGTENGIRASLHTIEAKSQMPSFQFTF